MAEPEPTRDGRAGPWSRALFARAERVIPGGVNSPVRAFAAVGGEPPFVVRAHGAHIVTRDGATLVDYVGTWGPALLGHAHPEIVEAVCRAARDGLSFGAATAAEVELAERLCELVPSLRGGLVRLVCSGTEATMSALRVARGFTGRDKIVKMDGGYHGHADMLLANAGSGAATLGIPGSKGVPDAAVRDTLTVPFNDVEALERCFSQHRGVIAAVIVEPVPGNMGCVLPQPNYLQRIRELTMTEGVLLIFDEVMTGFRLALGGAQELFGITPDLTCLGKVVGGGLPLAAYGGRRDVMASVAPLGAVYQAGTLSGNPLGTAAALTTLELLRRDPPYAQLETSARHVCEALLKAAQVHGVALTCNRIGSMLTPFFCDGPVLDHADAQKSDRRRFASFHRDLLMRGVYVPPSQFESWFVSTAHDARTLETTVAAAEAAFANIVLHA